VECVVGKHLFLFCIDQWPQHGRCPLVLLLVLLLVLMVLVLLVLVLVVLVVLVVRVLSGSQWGDHELLRSVQIPVDHGADDEFAGFDSKEEMGVAAMDRLARGTRETQDALAHEANTEREAADVEEDTQGVADAPCSFAEGACGDTDGHNVCFNRRPHPPTSTRELRCLCTCAA
jgi:hypothetical protein